MKPFVLATFAVLIGVTALLADKQLMAQGESRDERALLALEQQFLRAADEHDAIALGALIADDYVISYQTAGPGSPFRYSDKRRSIAHWTKQEAGVQALPTSIGQPSVHIAGNTGIVFGMTTDHWRDRDGEHAANNWVSDVWTRRRGRWILFASHETALP